MSRYRFLKYPCKIETQNRTQVPEFDCSGETFCVLQFYEVRHQSGNIQKSRRDPLITGGRVVLVGVLHCIERQARNFGTRRAAVVMFRARKISVYLSKKGVGHLVGRKNQKRNARALNGNLPGPRGVQLWRYFGLKPLCKSVVQGW